MKMSAKLRQLAREPHTPRAHCYIRCSHVDSAESGIGLEVQSQQCLAYQARLLDRFPELQAGEMYRDVAVSAYKYPLCQRRAGSALNARLQKGDHVIFAKMDRAFRTVKDAWKVLDDWNARGIELHFVDFQIDTTTPYGRAFFTFMALFAQMHSDLLSARCKEVAAHLKATRGYSAACKRGMKRIRYKGVGRDVPDRRKHVIGRYVLYLRSKGLTYPAISDKIEHLLAKREGRKPKGRYCGREFEYRALNKWVNEWLSPKTH